MRNKVWRKGMNEKITKIAFGDEVKCSLNGEDIQAD